MRSTTLTISRPDEDITVELVSKGGSWHIREAIDENGGPAKLNAAEAAEVMARAAAGEDETGL